MVAGSTGEAATLSVEEQQQLLKLVIKTAARRIPVIAGTGTNSTATTIQRTQMAADLGADACLIVTPYYNRPTQEGLIQHFTQVAKAVDIPIILYNVPTRTACDMQAPAVGVLSALPNVIGIKEATGSLERLQELKKVCTADFRYYSGDDLTTCDFILQGGHGSISVTANIMPNMMQKMCQFALNKAIKEAKALDEVLHPLHQLLFIEPNPIPVKWALNHLGKIDTGIRLPLTPLTAKHHAKLKEALQITQIH